MTRGGRGVKKLKIWDDGIYGGALKENIHVVLSKTNLLNLVYTSYPLSFSEVLGKLSKYILTYMTYLLKIGVNCRV